MKSQDKRHSRLMTAVFMVFFVDYLREVDYKILERKGIGK